jgi:hypothetical protein
MQKQLLKQVLLNPDLLSDKDREKLFKSLVANLDNLDR